MRWTAGNFGIVWHGFLCNTERVSTYGVETNRSHDMRPSRFRQFGDVNARISVLRLLRCSARWPTIHATDANAANAPTCTSSSRKDPWSPCHHERRRSSPPPSSARAGPAAMNKRVRIRADAKSGLSGAHLSDAIAGHSSSGQAPHCPPPALPPSAT